MIDGARFGFVRMASRADALRAIERLDGCVLYGSRVRVLFAGVDVEGAKVECGMGKLCSVEGAIDDEKLVIMHTYAIGWVKKVVSIRVLAREMAEAGLEAFKLEWVAGSMVLLAFLDLEQPEEREIDSGSEDGDTVQHGNSVVSSISHESRQMIRGRSPCFPDLGKADSELVVQLVDTKVKSVNSLVKALGSSVQQGAIASARLKRGCGRPAKSRGVVDRAVEGGAVANASLTDSDI
ncbi:hypothetical protein V6N12_035364 [Hibiscus sabdariffa]|uniref:RRM domain-containing protein n=1 Tax=Hibiscus sabdariffa TaxID=183260 RepID=A0ABR2BSM8_9ROSI